MKPTPAAQERRYTSPANAVERQAKRTFTSDKLDLINALNADARISGNAYKVAVCVINHLNEKAGYAFPSVETVGIKTRLSRSSIERALKLLRKTGWLRSRKVYDHKTRTQHNRYSMLDGNLDAIADEQAMLLDEAREARQQPKPAKKTAAQNVAQPVTSDGTVGQQPVTSDGTQPVTSEGVTPEKKHLTRKIAANEERLLVVGRGTWGAKSDGWPGLLGDGDGEDAWPMVAAGGAPGPWGEEATAWVITGDIAGRILS